MRRLRLRKNVKVEVIERHHDTERGKGFALQAGITYLSTNPPEVVVVLDADCQFEIGSVEALAKMTAASQRPCQCRNLIRFPDNFWQRIDDLCVCVFSQELGSPTRTCLSGMPVLLTGTGMAFPWQQIAKRPIGIRRNS